MVSSGRCSRVEFARQLSDNCVEYRIFLLGGDLDNHDEDVEALQNKALELSQSLTRDYIWQRDGFELELKTKEGHVHLHGVSDYGDAMDDEWLIVYLLMELTKSHPHLWVRVADSDGEFLLIEAASVLPSWLSPEMDQNRVWIHAGKLLVIPPTNKMQDSAAPEVEILSLSQAIDFIQKKPGSLFHDSLVQNEAFRKLTKYPKHIEQSAHFSLVTIPRKLAHVLHTLPNSLASAVEAFYLRDVKTLQSFTSTSPSRLIFPPQDLVTMSVHFSKVLFAQLKSQRFEPPLVWQQAVMDNFPCSSSTEEADKVLARLDMGTKLTCAFEMLALSEGGRTTKEAQKVNTLLLRLEKHGAPNDKLPLWPHHSRNDDESWVNVDFQDFERELHGNSGGETQPPGSGSGDSQIQTDLGELVSRFKAFFDDDVAGLDGASGVADDDSADGRDTDDAGEWREAPNHQESVSEDAQVTFDEAAYSVLMREMVGLAPSASVSTGHQGLCQEGNIGIKTSRLDSEGDGIQHLSAGMEAELRRHDMLQLDRTDLEKQIMQPNDENFENEHQQESEDVEDNDAQVDINYHVARNLLESFKSQAGMAGPTGNLLGILGLGLPRDESQDNEAGLC